MENIRHSAIVVKAEKNKIFAKVQVKSACGACALRGACGIGDCADKIVEITTEKASEYPTGTKIDIILEQNSGFYALFLGYIFPLILTLSVLFGMLLFGFDEIACGICAIIVLIPYYFCLSLCRKRLQKKFLFKIDNQ